MSTPTRDRLLEDFDDELAATRRYLERVPEDRLDWKPHEKSMSLGQLAGHLAESPAWIEGMQGDEFDLASLDGTYVPFVPTDRAGLLEALEKSVAVFQEKVRGWDEGALAATWTMRMGDRVVVQAPRHVAIRRTIVHHWIHHRGQLSVYLRELGVPLPPVYGPTADQASFA